MLPLRALRAVAVAAATSVAFVAATPLTTARPAPRVAPWAPRVAPCLAGASAESWHSGSHRWSWGSRDGSSYQSCHKLPMDPMDEMIDGLIRMSDLWVIRPSGYL